ncbi:glycosyltransferase [Lachnospiraceae bacterium 56-18]
MEDILVSIWCTTYNHELYIKDAIESFLAQKTNFRYEIIIHDDASTDSTAEIIRNYESKYPGLIFPIYQTKNQYKKNHPSIKWIQDLEIQKCNGKYIAVCEGDDYWVDNRKLQLQIEYLEAHPECVMTVHDATILDCRQRTEKEERLYSRDCVVSEEDIISQKLCIRTASMVYRKEVLKMGGFFLNTGVGDYPTLLYSFTLGSVYYFNRVMSVYRQFHAGSWTASISNVEVWCVHNIRMIDFLIRYNEYTKYKHDIYIIVRIQKSAIRILQNFEKFCKEDFFNSLGNLIIDNENKIYCRLKRLWMHLYDENYISENVYEFCAKYSKIVIMGAGNYAGIIARKLECHSISFEGFVISNEERMMDRYLGKRVWKFESIPYELKKVGIIIGINPIIWNQIIDSLNKAGANNYICPFLF